MVNLHQQLHKLARAVLKKAANKDLAGGVPKVMHSANKWNKSLE